jgi:hypothetical protein
MPWMPAGVLLFPASARISSAEAQNFPGDFPRDLDEHDQGSLQYVY